jgi:hypothetical protein
MNVVSQWWIGGLRTRKAKVAGSIPAGGSTHNNESNSDDLFQVNILDNIQSINIHK